MESVVIIFLVILVNIVLWIVFFVKFKNLFSTEDIINNTHDELNQLVASLQRTVMDCVTLMDEKTKELKAVSAEADRHIANLKHEMEMARGSYAIVNQIEEKPIKKKNITKKNPYKKETQEELFENVPKVNISETPIQIKADFNEQVKQLSMLGKTVDEIAKQLSRSTTEVEFALEMN